MTSSSRPDLTPIRQAMAELTISPRVDANEHIGLERVFFPPGHRSVLDIRRQLVVGNRGVGKSFWTHALTNPAVRDKLARDYSFPALAHTTVVIGFNGSTRVSPPAPTIDEIKLAHAQNHAPELIWRAAVLRAIRSLRAQDNLPSFAETLSGLDAIPAGYASELTALDDELTRTQSSVLIVFDALDRLAARWDLISQLTKGLLITVLGLQSFLNIRAKVFMRVDQFFDVELFRFPDSSKLRNDRVDLAWRPRELFGLLIFELLRNASAQPVIDNLAESLDSTLALPLDGRTSADFAHLEPLINTIAGQYMGKGEKRGRVFTWVPLHLSDATNNCSPRSFLTAWQTAAHHNPPHPSLAVDHLGIFEGVRVASQARLTELKEDYPWIDSALKPLSRQFVPIAKQDLFSLWNDQGVIDRVLQQAERDGGLPPVGLVVEHSPEALLQTMTSIAVMEERTNGKINVPDIFRVEAGILRKGGVAVPRKN